GGPAADGAAGLNADGTVLYTPAANFNGRDTFTYTIGDGHGATGTATVVVIVNPVNDAPVAADDAYTAQQGTILTVAAPGVLANDVDVDRDALTATLASGPSHGSVVLGADGVFTYTADAGFTGQDRFSYQANDGQALSNVAAVAFSVLSANGRRQAGSNTVTTLDDGASLFGAPDFGFSDPNDPPPDTLRAVKITTLPAAGTLALTSGAALKAGDFVTATDIAAGKLRFTPAPNANGAGYAAFTFQVQDDGGTANGGVDLD